MLNLTITKDNGELIESAEDTVPGLLPDTEPATFRTEHCQACTNFDHSRMICQGMLSRSQVIEDEERIGDVVLMAEDEHGYLGFQQSSPLSLSLDSTPNPSPALLKLEKAIQADEDTYHDLPAEDAPLPLADNFSQLSFAANSNPAESSDSAQVINDDIGWGVPDNQSYEEVMHNGDWNMHIAEWEAMNNTFTPADVEPWNYYSTGQDQENTVDYDMEEETEEGEEEMDAGTF
jgi:hypothetical protein